MILLKRISLGLFVSLLMISSYGIAQSVKNKKIIDKCWKVYHKKGVSAAIGKLRKHMSTQSFSSLYAHESLVRMEHENFIIGGEGELGFTLSINGEVSDSIFDFMKILNESSLKIRFVNVCRRSTIESTSPSGDRYLQELMIHVEPDTAISEKSQSYFDEAEEFYEKQDFELAAMNYRKAFNEEPSFYKAKLYLGTTYLQLEEEDSALYYYDEARKIQPMLLEPRIYIINQLINKGLYYRAKKECIEALTIYPGYNMKFKLNFILDVENKYLNEHRITRTFFPNRINKDDQANMDHDPVWKDYRKSKDMAKLYCDEDGFIEPNAEIEDRYLEVYSYRNMLRNHQNDLPEILHFADKMMQEGFLEPYVFISQFHYDFYEQFKDYVSVEENRAKCIEYVEKYLVTSNSKR